MHGFVVGTRWFAQKIERAFFAVKPRQFDKEKNAAIAAEILPKVDDLMEALDMGIGVQEVCVEIGMRVNMIAMNHEMRKGKEPEDEVKPAVSDSTPDVEVPIGEAATTAETVQPEGTEELPMVPKTRGRKKSKYS